MARKRVQNGREGVVAPSLAGAIQRRDFSHCMLEFSYPPYTRLPFHLSFVKQVTSNRLLSLIDVTGWIY
jgi:hypothetical protein